MRATKFANCSWSGLTGGVLHGILFSAMHEMDNRLILELGKDARQSSAELSAKLGVSETTVRRRIRHLEELGIITFAVVPDPAKLGYNIIALIALEVDLNRLDAVSESLAQCPNVRHVALCTGNHDIFIGVWFHTSAELTQFVKDYLARIPGIRKSETYVVLDVRKDEIGWLRSLEPAGDTKGDTSRRKRNQ